MTALLSFLSTAMVERIGWTLAHFVWQGTLVAILLAVVLMILDPRKANARYLAASIALFIMFCLPVITVLTVERAQPISAKRSAPMEAAVRTVDPISSGPMHLEQPPRNWNPRPSSGPAFMHWFRKGIERTQQNVQTFIPWIVFLWLIGIMLLSIRLTGGLVYLARVRRAARPLSTQLWRSRMDHLCRRIGLGKSVPVAECPRVTVPNVLGVLRPLILFPASILSGLSGDQIEAILLHELAHIRRHDNLINLLQTVVETLLFYHPAVWWVSHKMRAERELASDEIAVLAFGDRLRYASALARMEEIRARPLALAVAVGGGALGQRIRRLMGVETSHTGRSTHWIGVVAVAVVLGALGAGARFGQGAQPVATGSASADSAGERARLAAQVIRAIEEGKEERAMDLLSKMEAAPWNLAQPENMDFLAAEGKLLPSRYKAVFTTPANADSMYPIGGWDRFGPAFGVSTGIEFAKSEGPRPRGTDRWCPPGKPDDPCYLVVQRYAQPHIVVDLNADGDPDLVYDGTDATIHGSLTVATDRAPDGRRVQWLLASEGQDPRRQAQIWLYKDGPFFAVLVDIDGDGNSNCGRSGFLPPDGTSPPPTIREGGIGSFATLQGEDAGKAKAADIVARTQAALRESDDAAAMDRLCDAAEAGIQNFDMEFLVGFGEIMHRRYNTVFRIPANADRMTPFGWADFGPLAAFGNVGGKPPGPAYLTVLEDGNPAVTVDLERDGNPELTYNGTSASIADGFSVIIDRAVDGRRAQWLVSPAGIDPRERVQIWLLKDGRHVVVLVDTDGDGLANCGRSTCLR